MHACTHARAPTAGPSPTKTSAQDRPQHTNIFCSTVSTVSTVQTAGRWTPDRLRQGSPPTAPPSRSALEPQGLIRSSGPSAHPAIRSGGDGGRPGFITSGGPLRAGVRLTRVEFCGTKGFYLYLFSDSRGGRGHGCELYRLGEGLRERSAAVRASNGELAALDPCRGLSLPLPPLPPFSWPAVLLWHAAPPRCPDRAAPTARPPLLRPCPARVLNACGSLARHYANVGARDPKPFSPWRLERPLQTRGMCMVHGVACA
jgi:hypothetical protein